MPMNNNFTKMSIRKAGAGACIFAAAIIGTALIPNDASAHGFVEKPGSRAALCSQTYGALNLNCGSIIYEPQSLEAPKGFPGNGPADGVIASAGGKFGGILDQQKTDR
jgi:chitin-binding protein